MAQANFLPTLARMVLSLCMGAVPLALQANANFTAISSAEKASNVEPTSQPAPPKKTKKAKAPKPPVNPSTGENKSERDKRLLRECHPAISPIFKFRPCLTCIRIRKIVVGTDHLFPKRSS